MIILFNLSLSTIVQCDTIYVMDNGGILENGTHRELLDKKGRYYDLYQAKNR